MQFTQQQLDDLWNEVRSGLQAQKADLVRPMAVPGSFDVMPVVVVADAAAEVFSVPIKEGTERVVYARKPGGKWVELP